ncbi:restriction endonuclease subunit S [Aliarcobacter butzleri]|uniref:restriction endonuclease subunit S n=1 Tax=Aliarcobacter butzleri TaxID=28197 RepID=UPI003ADF9DDF
MIDNLPNGWRVEELGNCVDILDNQRIPLNNQDREERIKGKNISELFPYYGATQQVGYIDDFLFDEELVLLGEDGVMFYDKDKQKAYLINGKSWVNNHAHVLRAKKNITINKYLVNFLNTFHYKGFVSGATRLKLNQSRMAKIPIPIPPLEQQKKIVKVLDLTSNLIEKQKELLKKYDLFLKSKFIEMFGDPISNPMGWENDVLSNVCPNKGDFVDGPFGSDLKVSDRTDEGIRIIQINNVGENEFRDKNKAFIRQEKYLTLKRHEVLQNDIIIAKMGEPIARSCFLPKHIDKAIIVADCMRMRITNNDYNRVFICFYLNFYTTKVLIDNLSHGSTRTRINLSILKTLEIIKPKVELQNKFALIVEKIETIKEKENQKLKQMNDLHNSMMNKAFKGEIK